MANPDVRELIHVRRASWIQRSFSFVGILAALIASVIGFWQAIQQQKKASLQLNYAQVEADAARSAAELARLREQLNQIRASITEPSSLPPETEIAKALTQLTQDSTAMSARLKALEDALVATPEKALLLPLMRKDLENEHNTVVAETTALRAEIARLYDFNKWFFGLIATIALSILGLVAKNLFVKKGAEEKT